MRSSNPRKIRLDHQTNWLRSTAMWNFNLQNGDYYIPFGLGAGKVWQLSGGTTLNFFVEPQITAFHEGIAPHWQIFSGINLQFPLKRQQMASPRFRF